MKSTVIFLCLGYFLLSSATFIYKKDWTKLIVTHHWPQTFCNMVECTTNFSYWTLHGLWPNPGCECNKSWHFNESLIEDLMPQMKTFWPDLINSNSTTFWKHEWIKHGTCAAKEEILNSQHKYFSKALELYHKLDLSSVLKKNNILPSEEPYKLAQIHDGILNSYGVMPKIQCASFEKGSKSQNLGQIEICFDKQFELMDCEKRTEELQNDNSNTGFSVCEEDLPVYYPPLKKTLQRPKFL